MRLRFGWTKALGDAVLAQQADMMDAIQRLRSKAHDNKKLTSTKERLIGLACALIRDAAVPAGRHSGSADKVSAEMIRQLARRLHKSIQFQTDWEKIRIIPAQSVRARLGCFSCNRFDFREVIAYLPLRDLDVVIGLKVQPDFR
jgi:hypothetical protein